MNVEPTVIADVVVLTRQQHDDNRGYFSELFNSERYREVGILGPWIQDNLSRSVKGDLRGLHFQHPNPQGKLVTALRGCVFDVAVDLRKQSPTFGRWVGEELSDVNRRQLWVPPGCAHGFLAQSDDTEIHYKCSQNPWVPSSEYVLRWDDADIGINWPMAPAIMNDRDRSAPSLAELDEILSTASRLT